MTAKAEDIWEGDILIADEGFPCLTPGPHTVKLDTNGRHYVECSHGHHLLDGQNQDGILVGLSRP